MADSHDCTDPHRSEYRLLPGIDALLRQPAVGLLVARYGSRLVTETARSLLAETRAAIATGGRAPDAAEWPLILSGSLATITSPALRPLINATGIIIHTNLGRALLSAAARQAVDRVVAEYSNLEFDLDQGSRGSRYDHCRQLLQRLTGAEDALVVNNNAAAVYLMLTAMCHGRQVLISRGELVEIGGGFRLPDVLQQSGARLVEVGTTNRTHSGDYARALTPDAAAILRVHASNFAQIGFVLRPELADLVAVAREWSRQRGTPLLVLDDLGSGSLLDTTTYGLAWEPMVQQSISAGADLVTFSGDKLLGGPQAGLIVGRAHLLAQIRRHPLVRALRVDKMTLAALEATLGSYLAGRAPQEIPVWQMIAATPTQIRTRARRWQRNLSAAGVRANVVAGESAVGGGSLPGETLATALLSVATGHPDAVAARLRRATPAVVCRIQQDHLLFDPRTVLVSQEDALVAAVVAGLTDS